MPNRLTKNESNNSWYGYLWRWGDEIPERPGQQFKSTDRTVLNIPALTGVQVVGAIGTVWNIQKIDAEGVRVVIVSDEDLTDYAIGYNLTSDNDIVEEHPYDAPSGQVRYRLIKYPIKDIVLTKVEPDARAATRPLAASLARPKRA